ncbi:class I SAM-dependent DNA methyltransferase [Methanobacterium sp.]|uniref:class I SAM-dependent DNA methyltransferase n=1 Tax=Methanobacterium sp. TaxID=2164 RepID=UPI003C743DCA
MANEQLYKKFAGYYDKIYGKLDHQKESEFIKWAVNKHGNSKSNLLLDIACGTGRHANLLKNNFEILGVDINKEMLDIARDKMPDVEFITGDMKKLNLRRKFDAVICMYSAINYNVTFEELELTLKNFHDHLNDAGVLIFDMGINKENWTEGNVSVDTVVDGNLKLARISKAHLENGVLNSNFVFLIKDNGKIDFDVDEHKLGVFEIKKVIELMESIGFDTFIYSDFKDEVYEIGNGERPVFVGVK